jgi:hypothetical protein
MVHWGYELTEGEPRMSLNSHLQELRRKHQTLSDEVEKALRSPAFDDLAIVDLKKQKLKLKEEIERLSHA